jgi:hypothetical protein
MGIGPLRCPTRPMFYPLAAGDLSSLPPFFFGPVTMPLPDPTWFFKPSEREQHELSKCPRSKAPSGTCRNHSESKRANGISYPRSGGIPYPDFGFRIALHAAIPNGNGNQARCRPNNRRSTPRQSLPRHTGRRNSAISFRPASIRLVCCFRNTANSPIGFP